MHKNNIFVTLTYSDENLPTDYSVDVRPLQLFMKRLRERTKTKIRYYAVGEYGDLEQRPHYHALIFNCSFNDQILHTKKNNIPIYTSFELSELWPYGFSTIGSVNYQTAAYCARYSLKKIGGNMAAEHYLRVHPITGKFTTVQPEFQTSSTSPGIGASWFHKYKSDVFPSDFLVWEGKKHPVPKYYLKLLAQEEQERVKQKRRYNKRHPERKWNNSKARLKVREEVFADKIKQLKRTL